MKSDIKIIKNSSKAQSNSQNNNLSKQVIFNGKNLVNKSFVMEP